MRTTLDEMYERARNLDKLWFDMGDLVELGRSTFWWYAQGRGGCLPYDNSQGKYRVQKAHVMSWLCRLGAKP